MPRGFVDNFSIFGSGRRYEEIKKNSTLNQKKNRTTTSNPKVTQESYERNLTVKFSGLKLPERMTLLNSLKQEALEGIAKDHNLNLSLSQDLEKAMVIGAKISPMLFSNILLKSF